MHREQRALHIDAEHRVEAFLADRAQGFEDADAGVGQENVDAALLGADPLEQAIEVVQLRDVALYGQDAAADLRRRAVQLRLAPAGDDHLRALRREPFGAGQADAAVGAGDDRDLALKSAHGLLL